jgi:hydroxyacylglutathione hydrolase
MVKPGIKWKRIGYSNSVLIVNGSQSILVDTGVRGNIKLFKRFFEQNQLKPQNIKLIILTHTHYDHTGNLTALKEMTGADVLVHKNEFENLRKGYIPIPDGQRFYTRIITRIGQIFMPKFASPEPFTADIMNENEFDLKDFGIPGKVISTPGHSTGSQSVVIGDAIICGDVFMNLRYGAIFPHFAENPFILIETWEKIFNLGIKKIYPGHGKMIKVEKVYPAYKKWKKKIGMA